MRKIDRKIGAAGRGGTSRRAFLASTAATFAAMAWTGPFDLVRPARAAGGRSGTLVIAVAAAIEDLDPATNVNWAFGLFPVYDSLTRLKGASIDDYEPWLAESVTHNADFTAWTFKIRGGVRFHDGTACDAAAVKKAIVRTISHPYGLGYAWALEDPEASISVDDASTLTFNLGAPRPYFAIETAGQYGFGIASPTAAETHSNGPDDLGSEYLQSNPVGTGPYRFESMIPGQEIVYVRNPDFWGGWDDRQFEKIIVKTVPVSSTRQQMLAAGEADIILPGEPEDIVKLRDNKDYTMTVGESSELSYIAMATDGRLKDPRVRRAFCHAFDEAAYIRDVRLETALPPAGAFPTMMATVNPDIRKPSYDPAEANRLLDEAGFDRSQELTYDFFEGNGALEGELFQAWLADLGITLKLVEKPYSGFLDGYFGDAPAENRADFFFFSWWPAWNHPADYAWPIFSGHTGSGTGNVGRYANEEATALIDALTQADVTDPETIKQSERLQQILAVEDPPWIPVAQEQAIWGHRRDIEGLQPNAMYVLTLDMTALSRTS